eukprot:4835476-Pleurochrysis_carterae.AAC.1
MAFIVSSCRYSCQGNCAPAGVRPLLGSNKAPKARVRCSKRERTTFAAAQSPVQAWRRESHVQATKQGKAMPRPPCRRLFV